jgi:menaquinol-cytochrome c reductase iron-sulfur subunit
LLIQRAREQGDDTVEIGDADRFETGKPEEVVYFRTRLDGWKRSKEKTTAWVVKMDPQHIIAFSPQCTHLGCAYHWEAKDKNFACPCHASAFSMEGKVLAGPAPRPLDRFVTRIEGGKLLITSDIERA